MRRKIQRRRAVRSSARREDSVQGAGHSLRCRRGHQSAEIKRAPVCRNLAHVLRRAVEHERLAARQHGCRSDVQRSLRLDLLQSRESAEIVRCAWKIQRAVAESGALLGEDDDIVSTRLAVRILRSVLRRVAARGRGVRCVRVRISGALVRERAVFSVVIFRDSRRVVIAGPVVNNRRLCAREEATIPEEKPLKFRLLRCRCDRRRRKLAVAVDRKAHRLHLPGIRERVGEITRKRLRVALRKKPVHRLAERAPLRVHRVAHSHRERVGLLLVKFRRPALEDDLLLLRAAQSEPAEHHAREQHCEQEYPDVFLHRCTSHYARQGAPCQAAVRSL